jgi:hypothetical protein
MLSCDDGRSESRSPSRSKRGYRTPEEPGRSPQVGDQAPSTRSEGEEGDRGRVWTSGARSSALRSPPALEKWSRRLVGEKRGERAGQPALGTYWIGNQLGLASPYCWPLRYCHPPGPAKLFSFLLSCENSETRAGQQQRVTASERSPTCSCSPSPLAAEITLSRSPLPQSVRRSLSLTERHRRSSGRCVNFTSPRPRPRAVVSRRAAATTATLFILLPRTENRR